MDRDTIIDGLRMTMDLCVFDPSTGEEIEPHLLNDISRATYDACKGALEILERLDTDSDTISRQAAIDLLKQMRKDGDMIPWEGKDVFARIRKLPSAQPEIIRCKDCKYHYKGICPIERYFSLDGFCGRAERRTE